jgi:outer membrane protein
MLKRQLKRMLLLLKKRSASDLKRKYFGQEGELAKLRENLIKPIQDQIYAAVKAVSERLWLFYIV